MRGKVLAKGRILKGLATLLSPQEEERVIGTVLPLLVRKRVTVSWAGGKVALFHLLEVLVLSALTMILWNRLGMVLAKDTLHMRLIARVESPRFGMLLISALLIRSRGAS
ncbi:UNVERIFIED_CONTAM: hypothetical protein Sradi_2318400 [Sesamum radiatum]|uniref:Uncharacterized protein n=1 Tax=Sesamum radiatum TaxID=300843 RepID=A0AAW2T7X6_SESRA